MNNYNKTLTYNEIAKIAEEWQCVLLSNGEWEAFTNTLWRLDQENKRLKKINEKLRREK
jgi:hypothetical protein